MQLNCGYFYKPVINERGEDFDDHFSQHLTFASSLGERLSKNYNLKSIKRMFEYGYVYDQTPSKLVLMVGLEQFGEKILRAESRLFVHPSYRSHFWKSPDSYESVKLQINHGLSKCDFLFKSREAKNPGALNVSARRDQFFASWNVYPRPIELKYKNNWQWIMYRNIKGNVEDHVSQILFKL